VRTTLRTDGGHEIMIDEPERLTETLEDLR